METPPQLPALKSLFSFPFQDAAWQQKFLVGSLLVVAGFFIPFMPYLLVLGYISEIMRRRAQGDGSPTLPEWSDWGRLLVDGLRLFGVTLVTSLPAVFVTVAGTGLYFASVFSLVLQDFRGNDPQGFGPLFFTPFLGMGVFFLSMSLMYALLLAQGLLLPPAAAHVAANGHLRAFFSADWLKVFRANWAGFLITFFVGLGLGAVLYTLGMVLYMTLILIVLLPFVAGPVSFYALLILADLSGQAYREGRAVVDGQASGPGSFESETGAAAAG